MLPAPSLEEMRRTLQSKQTPVVGILFAPPYTKIASERIVPRLGYLDSRTGQFLHFFVPATEGTNLLRTRSRSEK